MSGEREHESTEETSTASAQPPQNSPTAVSESDREAEPDVTAPDESSADAASTLEEAPQPVVETTKELPSPAEAPPESTEASAAVEPSPEEPAAPAEADSASTAEPLVPPSDPEAPAASEAQAVPEEPGAAEEAEAHPDPVIAPPPKLPAAGRSSALPVTPPRPAPPPAAPVAAPEPAGGQPAVTAPRPPAPPPPAPAAAAHAIPGAPVEGAADDEDDSIPELVDGPADAAAYEAMLGAMEEQIPSLQAGDRRTATVVGETSDGFVVDIGFKTEGLIRAAAVKELPEQDRPQYGQQIEVTVESPGSPGDYAIVNYVPARQEKVWDEIETAFHERKTLTGKITETVKGGFTVDLGVPAFMPGSHADTRPVKDLESLVGTEIEVRVVKLGRRRGNIVVSHREIVEEDLKAQRATLLASLSEDSVVKGTVKNITDYGAFIDLGGLDGLIHVTDLTWGRIKNPSEVLKVGDEIEAKVLKFDTERQRVSLSRKHLTPDPWANAEEQFSEGALVKGTISSITDYGVFVALDDGLEGLIHVSELTWSRRMKHPAKMLTAGEPIEAVVLKVSRSDRRISLSYKRAKGDPWDTLPDRYPVGSIVEGKVRNLTTYGAFVEIEEGVDGLIHVSDLSWSGRVKHPRDVVHKGQSVRAVVLLVDTGNRRLSLGLKQLQPDAWDAFFGGHTIGDLVRGRVARQAKFGYFVELADGVEGLLHNSELGPVGRRGRGGLDVGKEYAFHLVKLDEFQKRIGLTRRDVTPEDDAPAEEGEETS